MGSEPALSGAWRRRGAAAASLLLLVACACADFARGRPVPQDTPSPTDGGVAAGAPQFAADVHPVLIARCQGCHSAAGSASTTGWVLTGDPDADYVETLPFVDESAPADSRLLSKASGLGHGGGTLFRPGDDDYELVLTWVQSGALP